MLFWTCLEVALISAQISSFKLSASRTKYVASCYSSARSGVAPLSKQRAGPQMHKVFVYGTLMANEVVSALLDRDHERFPAKLQGFKRYRIRQQVFPAIIPGTVGDIVEGWVGFEMPSTVPCSCEVSAF